MKTQTEVLESGATLLTVTIEASEIDARIRKTYADFGTKYKFPGFRKGHVPRQIIDANFGKEAVRAQVTDELINEKYPLAVDENDLVVIDSPEFKDVDGIMEEGKDFTFSVELKTKPQIELSNYDPVHIVVPFRTATEAEIDAQLKAMADVYYDYKDLGDDAQVAENGVVVLKMTTTDQNGEAVTALTFDDRTYELGAQYYPENFEAELLGMKKGDTKAFTLDVDTEKPNLFRALAKDADTLSFDVEILGVKEKTKAEFTDEFVQNRIGFESVEQMRTALASQIEAEKAGIIPGIMETNALYALLERVPEDLEIPESMRGNAEMELMQTFFQQLQNSGDTYDNYLKKNGMSPDTFRDDLKKQASDTIKQNLALDAVARHEGIVVTDEEVHDEFMNSGHDDPEALFAQWKSQGRLHEVREGIMRGKALEALLAAADIEEADLVGQKAAEDAAKAAEAEDADDEPKGKHAAPAAEDIEEDEPKGKHAAPAAEEAPEAEEAPAAEEIAE